MQKTQSRPPTDVHEMPWFSLCERDVLGLLDTHADRGLATGAVTPRREEYGPNELLKAETVSPWELLAAQFKNALIIILLLAVGLSAVLGHEVEAIAIAVIVLFAVLLGFIQEFRAERAMEALREMAAPTATVIRDGKEIEIPARDLVPGDIILLVAGDKIPADARVLESRSLHAEEASLTGESVAVEKHADVITTQHPPIGDRKNIVHAGTIVTYGRGKAVVVATGMRTEFGKIAGMLSSVEISETPLQKNLDRLGRTLAKAAFVVVLFISALGFLRGQPLLEIVIFGIALAVAVVPEALPAVVTISLAIGVQRMVKRHALVRRLPAVETLGSTSIICTDKTGTLTKDEMTVRALMIGGRRVDVTGAGYDPEGFFEIGGNKVDVDPLLQELLVAGALSSDARLVKEEGNWDIKGDPTEGALVVAAAKAGFQKDVLEEESPRIAEIPFTSETKRMTTLHTTPHGNVAYCKGAPEMLLPRCVHERTVDGEKPLSEARREEILTEARAMAASAMRMIGVAKKSPATLAESESGLTFLGLVAMVDPPRPEAKLAVATCAKAGIKVVMITGDHPATAQAIAQELGILRNGRIMTGAELDAIDQETFERIVEEVDVYARVSPAHKLQIVTALQKAGHVVAMTGDGVNDAPALKKADIGIAMGITGTDVTKEAASMTLTDDNFASIVAAVEEGRGIFGNIKKYLMYLLSSNIGEIALMTGATVAGVPLPLTAVQILYVNLATDGLPALALAVDPPEPDLMHRQPRNPRQSMFSRPVVALMLTGGLWLMVVTLGLFLFMLNMGRSLDEAMTMTFVCIVCIEFFKAYAFRSDRHSAFRKPFANTWLNVAILWELVLLALIIHVPFLQTIFRTSALSVGEWSLVVALSATVIPVLELAKWTLRRGWLGRVV